MSQKKIALIATGGTIAMAANSDRGGGVFKFTAEDLLKVIPQVSEIALIQTVDLFSIPSQSLSIGDFKVLHKKILELSSTVDGIVITHGTNVLEETAFGLSLLFDLEIPVVLTGAMRRADLPGADGPLNLLNAIQVAASDNAKKSGVLVVMNGEIFSGFFVKKQHAFLASAFSGGALGWVAEDRVRMFLKPHISKPSIKLGDQRSTILTIENGFDHGMDDLECIDFFKLDALIINATGVGHVSRNIVQALEKIAKAVPVIFASRTGAGETFKNYYGAPGAEIDLIARGIIPAGFLNSRQVRMLLLLAFSSGPLSVEQAKELMSFFN